MAKALGAIDFCVVGKMASPNDPLFQYQWFLGNAGQSGGGVGSDINVLPVWPDYTGLDVRVAIVDDGVQLDHPDLVANIDELDSWDAIEDKQGGGPIASNQKHGTAVAGLVAEVANNGIGGSGVAPHATLIAYRIGFDNEWVASAPVLAFEKALEADADVVNNSWGFNSAFYSNALANKDAAFYTALNDLGSQGRDFLGSIVLFSNGNDGASGYDGNLNNNTNSRYVIAVGALDDTGVRTSYSTPGANLLVSAPGGASTGQHDDRPGNGTLTADRTSTEGYNELFGVPGNYDYNFSGTSAAAPIVSGVVALMLDADDRLGYRDVQEILAHSAHFVDPGADTWKTTGSGNWNGGGALFSRDYGFGEVDAHAAVRLAEIYPFLHDAPRDDTNVVKLSQQFSGKAGFASNSATTITLTLANTIDLNHLDLTVMATIDNLSKVEMTLKSPSGTTITLLKEPKNPSQVSWPVEGFTLGTDAFWGEKSGGVWTLTIGGTGGTVSEVDLSAYGAPRSTEKEFVYTDDFARIIAADSWQQGAPSRQGLTVRPDETAVLDAAAVSSAVVVDLAQHRAVITGETIIIGATTTVTKVFTGDGNDTLVGDGNDNLLMAGRGSNTIDGGGGTDTLVFLGSRADYSAAYGSNGLFSAGALAHDTSDAAIRVEKGQFKEGTGYVQAVSDTGLGIVALYNGLLFRDPDAGGYRYWTDQAANGQGLTAIGGSFAASSEFANGAGKLDNASFVSSVYQHLLDRAPDAAEVAHWTAQLAGGAITRAGMVISLANSDEYQSTQLVGVFDTLAVLGNLWVGPASDSPSISMPSPLLPAVDEAPASTLPNDPLFKYQWFLDNTGQSGGGIGSDIDVLPVWPDYTGLGVTVAILDNGVQLDHPDLIANINSDKSWDAITNKKGGGPVLDDDNHGTAVAGLVAAMAGNGIGGSGVAPDAELISYRISLKSGPVDRASQIVAYQKALASKADILNDSWGEDNAFGYNDRDPSQAAYFTALDALATEGRNGLGAIVLFANGNEGRQSFEGNLDNILNSRHVIGVGAVDDNGVRTAYSTPGANLLVSAPAGRSTSQHEDRPGTGTLTTDRTSTDGYNDLSGAAGNYDYNFYGTSAATPIVSGVVALMLDANSDLGYRDVQEILAHSARFVDPGAKSWTTTHSGTWNGGGAMFSRDYGFGEVDAHAAVRLAEINPYLHLQPRSDTNVRIDTVANDKLGLKVAGDEWVTFQLKLTDAIDLNHLDLTLGASIADAANMTVLLISPLNTTITMIQTPPNASGAWPSVGFRMGTDAFWGEKSDGDWTVQINIAKGGTGGTIDSAILTAYGDPHSTEKEFVYTDDFANVIDADSWLQAPPPRTALKVAAGETAVIDAAAVSSDVMVDLAGHRAVIVGDTVTIDAGTKVTKVFTGDGNDTLLGDANDNVLLAGRGANTLDGGAGVDTALYLGTRAHYTATYSANGTFTVASTNNSDTAVRIEKASFEEGTLYVQAASDTGLEIAGLYNGLLFRDADAGGYRYWTIEASKGQTAGVIGASLLASSEYANGTGKLGNAAFVDGVYEHMLDREVDPAGAAYWTAALASGSLTRAGMVLSIIDSTEYQAKELPGLFTSIAALGDLWG